MADDRFQNGGKTLLAPLEEGAPPGGPGASALQTGDGKRKEALEEIRVRVGTLLKTETVSLLLGAGASVDCGGVLIGSVPLSVERELVEEGIVNRAEFPGDHFH